MQKIRILMGEKKQREMRNSQEATICPFLYYDRFFDYFRLGFHILSLACLLEGSTVKKVRTSQ